MKVKTFERCLELGAELSVRAYLLPFSTLRILARTARTGGGKIIVQDSEGYLTDEEISLLCTDAPGHIAFPDVKLTED